MSSPRYDWRSSNEIPDNALVHVEIQLNDILNVIPERYCLWVVAGHETEIDDIISLGGVVEPPLYLAFLAPGHSQGIEDFVEEHMASDLQEVVHVALYALEAQIVRKSIPGPVVVRLIEPRTQI